MCPESSGLSSAIALRIADRISWSTETIDCTAEEVERVWAGESLDDSLKEAAIRRELDEYGLLP